MEGSKTRCRTQVTGVIQMGHDGGVDIDHGSEVGETELRNTCRFNRT